MDFDLLPEQQRLCDEAREFASKELNDDVTGRDRDGVFPRELWRKCAARGFLGLCVAHKHGGQGLDPVSAVAVMEGFGQGCRDNGLAFGLNAQAWSVVYALQQFGSPAQKRSYLTPVCRGDRIGAFAMTEPRTGSDCFALEATAEPVAGGFRLNATKQLVTFAPIADFALIFARSDPSAGRWGISTFVVDRETQGYAASPVQDKMGLRSIPIGEIVLKDCIVPESALLGPSGAGASIFNSTQETERGFILASQVGAMARQLEAVIEHARTRRQFGRTIGRFQAVSTRIVEMKMRLETCRLLLYRTAWLRRENRAGMLEAALTKTYLADCYVQSSLDAIQIRGGRGYLSEFEIERDLRDAVGAPLYGGTSDIQRDIVARLLGL